MPIFMNPFQKHDVSDFPGVFVPLAQATRNPSVVADHDEKIGSVLEDKKLDDEAIIDPAGDYSANTIEGLRAEIEFGMLKTVVNMPDLD